MYVFAFVLAILAAGDVTILRTLSGMANVSTDVIDIANGPTTTAAITGFTLVADASGTFSTSDHVATGFRCYGAENIAPTPSRLTTADSAVGDMETAYTDAASRATSSATTLDIGDGSISGTTFEAGVPLGVPTSTSPSRENKTQSSSSEAPVM